MEKTYASYADEITPSELYKGLLAHGLFSEKLPPVFESKSFYDYIMSTNDFDLSDNFKYICFDVMRDIGVPRTIKIPHPIAYQNLCKLLSKNWIDICKHFHEQTDVNSYKISRIHIRKLKKSEGLFEMNYSNWHIDASPVPDIAIGKNYKVNSDISNLFPSIYTHSLAWAILGKGYAKDNRSAKIWENELDKICRQINYGESIGLPIGPHTSNILSEIILTVIDKNLSDKNWKFIRNIDDYECYTETYDKAQEFVVDLAKELREFNLNLNYKKNKIEKLPVASTTHWVRQLNAVNYLAPFGGVSYKTARAYIDAAIQLMESNGQNAAVIKYAIKVLSGQRLTENAKIYCIKTFMHLAAIYPYLIPMLDQYVFAAFAADISLISKFSQKVLQTALETNNCEAAAYAIFFAIKYNFKLSNFRAVDVIEKKDCILSVLTLLYFRKEGDPFEENALLDYALQLKQDKELFDENWVFVYEVLSIDQLNGYWGEMKKNGISFIRGEYRL